MKRAILVLFTLFFIFACAGPDTIIKPDKDTGDVKLTCVQSLLHNHKIFQQEFKFDPDMPELTVYARS